MFDDLKSAIEDVLADAYSQGKVSYNAVLVSSERLKILEKLYYIYFVEPEDDKEFQEWQNEVDE